jgi:hypothetical protein
MRHNENVSVAFSARRVVEEFSHRLARCYLRFRHVFRNAYSFDLDWQKMSPLVLRLEETFQMLEKALNDFLK